MGVKNSKNSKIIKILNFPPIPLPISKTKKKLSQNQNDSSILSLPISTSSFEFKYIIGKGGFGKVWKVLHKKTGNFYALKQMSKVKIIEKKSESSIKYERDLLAKIHHPFIVNMHYSFQDRENLYIVLDLLNGGDLRYHLSRKKKFSEEQTSIYKYYYI